MTAPADLLAQLSDAAASVAPARESITVGSVTFFAESPSNGETWFNRIGCPVGFCFDGEEPRGWYCGMGNVSGRGTTPQEAFAIALQTLVDSLLPLLRGGS